VRSTAAGNYYEQSGGGEANRPAKTGRRMVATASTRTSRQLLFYSNETAKKSPGRTGGPYRLRAAIGRPVVVPVAVAVVVIAVDVAAAAVDVAGAGLCGGRRVGGGRDRHRDNNGFMWRVRWWGCGGGGGVDGGPGVRWPLSPAPTHCFVSPLPLPTPLNDTTPASATGSACN